MNIPPPIRERGDPHQHRRSTAAGRGVSPLRYDFWGGRPTEAPEGTDIHRSLREAAHALYGQQGNTPPGRLANNHHVHQLLVDAFWYLFLTLLGGIDHDSLCDEHCRRAAEQVNSPAAPAGLEQQQKKQQQQHAAPTAQYQTLLPYLFPPPKHTPPSEPEVSSEVAAERELIFGRMSGCYREFFWSVPSRRKDVLLNDLPELLSAALRTMFVERLPYLAGAVESPQFGAAVSRHVSFWISGIKQSRRRRRRIPQQQQQQQQQPAADEEAHALSSDPQTPPPPPQDSEELRTALQSLRRAFADIVHPRGGGGERGDEKAGGDTQLTPVPPSHPPPAGSAPVRGEQAWYEKGKRANQIECQVPRGTFHLAKQSPLIERFRRDQGITSTRPSPRMTWVSEAG